MNKKHLLGRLSAFLLIIFVLNQCSESNKNVKIDIKNIQSGFIDPGENNKVWCYWYWINDDISREGITKDLEAMKEAGIGAAFIGNINPKGVDGPVPLFSNEWWECMVHAVNEGKRLGVDIGMFNCPGWSQSGGPWVKPDMAMRHLIYSEIAVKGPDKISVELLQPNKEFQDTHVLAFPKLKSELNRLNKSNCRIFASPAVKDILNLLDGDTATDVFFKSGTGKQTIDITTDNAIVARSIRLYPGTEEFKAECELRAGIDGKYVTIKSFTYDRSNNRVNVGPEVKGPVAISIPDIRAKSFRLICKSEELTRNGKAGFSEIIISEEAVLEKYVEKNLGKMFPSPLPAWNSYIWEYQEEVKAKDLVIIPGEVVDLSDKMDVNGVLNWEVPEGEWTVMCFGMTPTGTKNSPSAPQGEGYEIDKASSKLIRYHFEQFIGKLLERLPEESKSAFKYVIADSYEMGSQNWTDDFDQKFEDRFGYNPKKYLPVFSGRIVGSVEESERFLWDLRRSVADAVAYEYVGGLREISNEHNLKLWLENYGHWGFPSEFLMYGGQSNLVSGEFWNEGTLGNIECKSGSSAAHVYGKPVTSAEAFTASGKAFMRHPAMLKKRGDWSYTEGINHFVLHVYIHQPDDKRMPGVNAWFSTEFNRHNTWFGQAKSWIDYLRRCQHLLQQGKYAADVCYFIGEDAPMMTGARNPELPDGYSYDYINSEVILNRLSVKEGKFVLPDGMSYSIMVLPPLKTMRPALLTKIESLVAKGGVIFGQAPEKSPGLENFPESDNQVKELAQKLWSAEIEEGIHMKKYGNGYVVDELDLKSALQALGISKDVDITGDLPILWTHRTSPEMEIFFITNQSEEEINFTPSFRVSGLKPQLWDAVTGEIRSLTDFKEENGRTLVPIKLQALQSWFLVFTNLGEESISKGFTTNFPDFKSLQSIDNAWTVDFCNKDIGPKAPIIFETLSDWSQSDNEKIKYYSGTANYKTSFVLDNLPQSQDMFINLGDIGVMARVKLNGVDVGGTWIAPYRLKVTGSLNKGENTIEVEVVNLWRNRLLKDRQLPKDQRYTWHLVDDIRDGEVPHISGLIGPVRIEYY